MSEYLQEAQTQVDPRERSIANDHDAIAEALGRVKPNCFNLTYRLMVTETGLKILGGCNSNTHFHTPTSAPLNWETTWS